MLLGIFGNITTKQKTPVIAWTTGVLLLSNDEITC